MELFEPTRGQGLGSVDFLPQYLATEFPPANAPHKYGPTVPREAHLDDSALFELLVKSDAPVRNRLAALQELTRRDSPDLDRAILAGLRERGADERWKRALVVFAERTSPKDASVRSELVDELLAAAVELRDAADSGADEPMWAAIRMFGSLAPVARLHELLAFLRSQDRGTTRQVALQGMWSMLEGETPRESSELESVRKRVSELAAKYLDNDLLVSGPAVSLATFAYCVSVLLEASASPELTKQLLSLGRPRMVARSATIIKEAIGKRQQRGVSVDDLKKVLAELIGGTAR
jgi:hypothetical protein